MPGRQLFFFVTFGLLWAHIISKLPLVTPLDDPENPWSRPRNITDSWPFGHLNSRVGSYYNGTLRLKFNIEDNNDFEKEQWEGTACRSLGTLTVEYNGRLRIGRPNPVTSGNNTFAFQLLGWDKRSALEDSDLSEYESYGLDSEASTPGPEGPAMWRIGLKSSGDGGYQFNATAALRPDLDYPGFRFAFNFTEQCSKASPVPPSVKDLEYYYAFSGKLLYLKNALEDSHGHNLPTIPNPEMEGRFGDEDVALNMTGSYRMTSDITDKPGDSALLQGVLQMTFNGKLDAERSDRLLMDRDRPEWELTVGVDRGSDNTNAAGYLKVPNWVVVYGFLGIVLEILIM